MRIRRGVVRSISMAGAAVLALHVTATSARVQGVPLAKVLPEPMIGVDYAF